MLECTLAINGVRMYFLDGKHISRNFAQKYASEKDIKLAQCRTITPGTKLAQAKRKIEELKKVVETIKSEKQIEYVDRPVVEKIIEKQIEYVERPKLGTEILIDHEQKEKIKH